MHTIDERRTAGSRARPSLFRWALAALSGLVLAASLPAPASAHAALLSTSPEEGATVQTAPGEVAATFSEILDGPSTEIAVTGPEETPIEVEPATFDGDTFIQPMLYTAPGDYTIAFRVISEDGHRVDGSLTFTVVQIPDELYAEGAEPAEESDEDASETEETEETDQSEETASETETDAAAEDSGLGTGVIIAIVLLAALVVVGGGIVIFKAAGRRKSGAE